MTMNMSSRATNNPSSLNSQTPSKDATKKTTTMTSRGIEWPDCQQANIDQMGEFEIDLIEKNSKFVF